MSVTKVISLNVVVSGDTDVKQLEKDIQKVVDANKNLEETGKKAGNETEEAFKGANSAASNLKGGFVGVAEQIVVVGKAAKKGGKAMKAALLSTGIGALIVALGLVVEYWDEISELVTGVNEELEEQLRLQELIGLELDRRVKDNQRDLRNQRSREKREILRARILGANEKVITEIKRKGFLERQQIAEQELREAKELAKRAGLLDAETNAAAQKELERAFRARTKARLDAEIFDLQQQLPDDKKGKPEKREKEKVIGGLLTAEEQAEKLALKQQQFEELFDLERLQQEELLNLGKKGLEQLANDESIAEAKRTLDREAWAKRRKEIALEEAAFQRTILNTQADVLGQFGSVLQQLGEDNKAVAVAGIIAEQIASTAKIILATTEANAKAVAASPLTFGQPFVALNTISAGLGIASGVAAAAKAISALGGSGGGGASSSSGLRTGSQSAPSFNVVGTSGTNQLAESLNQNQDPIQAYVVSGNMTTQQALDRNIVDTATIG